MAAPPPELNMDAGLGPLELRRDRLRLAGGAVPSSIDRLGLVWAGGAMMVLQPAAMAPKLLFDAFGGLVEGRMRVRRLTRALEDHALHDMGDDIADEVVIVGPFPEGDMR